VALSRACCPASVDDLAARNLHEDVDGDKNGSECADGVQRNVIRVGDHGCRRADVRQGPTDTEDDRARGNEVSRSC
jgi:hypothetical protein